MDSTRFNNFIFKNYFLLNDKIITIETCKIEYQSNTNLFVWDCDNLIKNKPK